MQSGTCGNYCSPFMGPPPSSVHSCSSPWEWSQGLAAVSCSPGPRKPLAVEKAVGISCEWVAGYWETLSLLPLDALQPVHPLGGLFVSQHASVLRLSTLGGSEFQVGQEPWLSSPDLHLLGICTWTLADWASEAVHFGQTGGDVSLGFVGGAG